MIRDIMMANEAVTPNQREMEILHEYFPTCFHSDGSFDLTRFSEFLKDKVNVAKEGYELKFLGKNYARMLASLDTETVIVPDDAHNSKPENINSENVYISGDNLDGLKHLLKSYSGKIKCIYIDPPYNTGTDGFVYNDKFNFTIDDLMEKLSISEEQAKHILDLTTRGSASHSAWLMFMYPRLQLARDLLSNDGAIFISIDDNEQANLKVICDDIFGEENCMGTIARATGQTTGQDSGGLGSSFDYAFVYGKHPELDIAGIPLDSHDLKRFENEDERGWYAYDQLRKTGSNDRREDRPNMYYPIKNPDGEDLYPTAVAGYDSRWRVEKKTYDKLVEDGYVLWKKTTRNDEEVWWPYNEFLKRICQQTSIPIVEIHKAMCELANEKPNGIPADYINEYSVDNIVSAFADWRIEKMQTRFKYTRSNQLVTETVLTYKDGTPREVIKQGNVGTMFAEGTPSNKYLYNRIAFDSPLEKENIMTDIDEVVVYGKIPKSSIAIPTIVGENYSPDFMYVVKHRDGTKEFNIVVETKLVEKKSTLRGTEDAKIKCAEAFFKQLTIDGYTVSFHTQLSNKKVKQIIEEVISE